MKSTVVIPAGADTPPPHAELLRCLRGEPAYPRRLGRRMGDEAPACVWLAGDLSRFDRPQVAVVGSRRTPSPFLSAAERAARALSDGGWVITSGLARGADAAAFAGGAAGKSGTTAVPARGLNRISGLPAEIAAGRATFLSPAPPEQDFHAGLAIGRNAVIAALADVLILVASDWKGGSWYAVGRALREGTPVVALECGARTPPANAWLLERGMAHALPIDAPAERTLRLIERLHVTASKKGSMRTRIEPLCFLD